MLKIKSNCNADHGHENEKFQKANESDRQSFPPTGGCFQEKVRKKNLFQQVPTEKLADDLSPGKGSNDCSVIFSAKHL